MRKILISSVITFLILANPQIICAEPSETIKYLINEPASLFDLGLYRLNKELLKVSIGCTAKDAPLVRSISAEYNWELNRIEINIRYIYGAKKLPQNLKKIITYDINQQKNYLNIDSSTGKPFGQQSYLKKYFTHLGYKNKDMPKDLGKKLDHITVFIVKVYGLEAYGPEPKEELVGWSPLLDKNIYWSEAK